MPTIHTIYTGGLRTVATHLQSGNTLMTDAPRDNQGKGENFSPSDLLAASLGSCMLSIMGIAARTHGFEERLHGTEIDITKIMAAEPRRVAEVIVEFYFPSGDFNEKERKILEHAAHTCPVAKSLSADLKQTVIFNFPA